MKQDLGKTATCAHAWAHALQPRGRASNLYFEGKTIFSYGSHFPIATIAGDIVFFTIRKYSPTTAQHKAIALSAVSHKKLVYVACVPVGQHFLKDKDFLTININYWVTELKAALAALKLNPRKKSEQFNISRYLQMLREFIVATKFKAGKKLREFLNSPTLEAVNAFVRNENRQQRVAENKRIEGTQDLCRKDRRMERWARESFAHMSKCSERLYFFEV